MGCGLVQSTFWLESAVNFQVIDENQVNFGSITFCRSHGRSPKVCQGRCCPRWISCAMSVPGWRLPYSRIDYENWRKFAWCRMEARFSSGLRAPPLYGNWWMLTVIASLWIHRPLHSSLMADVCELNRPLLRFASSLSNANVFLVHLREEVCIITGLWMIPRCHMLLSLYFVLRWFVQ